MEPQTQQTQTTPSPDPVSRPKGFARCRAHNRSGSRCRLHVKDSATGLCFRHSIRLGSDSESLQDTTDLYSEIFAADQGVLDTAENINAMLSNIVALVARGRISSRRAAVITYALSLILRSVVIMERKAADSPPQIIFDAPQPDYSKDEPAASPQPNTEAHAERSAQAYPQTSHDALENYARQRT